MKVKLLFSLVLFVSFFARAQKEHCAEVEKQLDQFIMDKDYKQAYDSWLELQSKCPNYSEKTYLLGKEVLQYRIDAAENEIETTVRDLIKLFNQYDYNFPNNSNANDVNRAMALYENHVGSDDEIFSYLDKAFSKQKETFTNAEAIGVYFRLYYEKYKEGKSNITVSQLLEKYSEVTALCDANSAKLPQVQAEYARVIQGMKGAMSSLLICDNLIPFYQKNFESHKTDVKWLESAATVLSVKCKIAPIFETIASELHKISPSSKSNYFLGIYALNTRKQEQAISYFNESVDMTTDKAEKAKTAYMIASIVSVSDKAKSKEMVLIAMENDPGNGKYYVFLAELYANSASECASSENEKKALYKLASETVLKAGTIDPYLKNTAEKASANYLKSAAINSSLKNKSIKIGCWINETVQL